MNKSERKEYWKKKADAAIGRIFNTERKSRPSCSRAKLAERNGNSQKPGKPKKNDAKLKSKNSKGKRAGKPNAKEPDADSCSGKGKKNSVPISKKPEPELPQACYCHCFPSRNQLALARTSGYLLLCYASYMPTACYLLMCAAYIYIYVYIYIYICFDTYKTC
jgi:hypothetical protein